MRRRATKYGRMDAAIIEFEEAAKNIRQSSESTHTWKVVPAAGMADRSLKSEAFANKVDLPLLLSFAQIPILIPLTSCAWL